MITFFTWVASFLSGPVINGLIDAYRAKLAAANTTEQHAIDLAVADLHAQIEARKAAVAVGSTSVGGWVQAAFAFPIIVYVNKVLIWDKVLASWTNGSTDPVGGAVAVWCGLVISFYFGGAIVSGVVNTVAARFRK